MRKVLKIIKTRWLSVIAILILLIAIVGTLNYYLKDTAMIIDHKMTDVRGVFFEMFVEHNFFVGLEDIDFNNNLKIKSLLGFLEDVGGIHSNIVGYGLLDIPVKKRSWILINWKVKIFKRPRYAENLKIITL